MGKDPHFHCLLELQREQKGLSTSYAQKTEGPRNSREEMLENRGDALVLVAIVDINVLINVGVLMITPCYQDLGYILSEVTTIAVYWSRLLLSPNLAPGSILGRGP